ncbi:hypothetical protein BD769DRAFT_1671856 [Suillus cothurnatus]|nr:hypothetical protein BD769DRAFT_1671856 [Suillus cothurnatus]
MDTSNSARKHPMSPSTKAACKDRKIVVKRPKLEVADAEPSIPKREVPNAEPMFPLPPFRQTPGPISVSQVYLRRLILEHWEAELKTCEKNHARLVTDHWDAEVKRCEEAKQVQLLELLLAAHGICRLT